MSSSVPRRSLPVIIGAVVVILLGVGLALGLVQHFGGDGAAESATVSHARQVVAPGLVEPVSEELQLATDVVGRLKSVTVAEGDHVTKGQVLAEVENDDLKAALAQAQAVVLRRQAELEKLNNGARVEERDKAAAQLADARASEDQARREFARKSPLAESGVESRSTLDLAAAAAAEAEAKRQAMNAERALIEAAPRPEDVQIAQAELAEAQANVAAVQAQLDKTIILSPIDGVVLSRQKRAGEAVTNLPPTVIVHVGDISRLRVRADVDETDVAAIAVGQRASVTADAYPGQHFGGSIIRVGSALGRKNFRTERATEKVDTNVLETLIELDPDVHLPIGLRVDVWIDTAKTTVQPRRNTSKVSDASGPSPSNEPATAAAPAEASGIEAGQAPLQAVPNQGDIGESEKSSARGDFHATAECGVPTLAITSDVLPAAGLYSAQGPRGRQGKFRSSGVCPLSRAVTTDGDNAVPKDL